MVLLLNPNKCGKRPPVFLDQNSDESKAIEAGIRANQRPSVNRFALARACVANRASALPIKKSSPTQPPDVTAVIKRALPQIEDGRPMPIRQR